MRMIDSDADGLPDKEEEKLGTNPFDSDTDRDGLSDLAEIKTYHTDPTNEDTDGDGISDVEEIKKGLNPLVPNFQDFLIPRDGNNHKPHLLHTKRAFFYSLFFILLKGAVFGFAMAIPAEAFLAPDVLARQEIKLKAMVNQLRREQGVEKLIEEDKLKNSSGSKAADMAKNSYFSHVGPDSRDLAYFLNRAGYLYRVAGENLAMGFSRAEDVMNAWIKSPLHYQNIIDKDFSEIGIGLVEGKYDGSNTIFIAQHFGAPLFPAAPDAGDPAVSAKKGIGEAERPGVLGEQTKTVSPLSKEEVKAAENQMSADIPRYNKDNSRVFWKYDGEKTTFTAKAEISGEVSQAVVYLDVYAISLRKSADEENLYMGELAVSQPVDNFFKVAVAPSIIIKDKDGNQITDSIPWFKIKSVAPGLEDKYLAAKTVLPALTGKVFFFSNSVYAIAIAVFSIVLLLNIFIEIKKQHPHIIVQTLSVILLLFVLLSI